MNSLQEHPARGGGTPENRKLRQLQYGNKPDVYRVIYRVDKRERRVVVLHIRHGARDRFAASEIRSEEIEERQGDTEAGGVID